MLTVRRIFLGVAVMVMPLTAVCGFRAMPITDSD